MYQYKDKIDLGIVQVRRWFSASFVICMIFIVQL